jgi:rhodanese-related sulfurtransferase
MTLDRLLAFAGLHPLPVALLAAITVALVVNEAMRLMGGYQRLSPAQLTMLINREDALVVDVSGQADFEKGHIVGAKSLPLAQFDPAHKWLAKAQERPVALVCRTGAGSTEAAKRLVKAGFQKVSWLEGGLAAWQQADLPLVRGRN